MDGLRLYRRLTVVDCFFFQAEDGIRDYKVTGVQTCALPICPHVVTRHVGTFEEATSDELGQSMDLVQAAVRALRSAYHPDGFNLGANQGRVAEIGRASCRERG